MVGFQLVGLENPIAGDILTYFKQENITLLLKDLTGKIGNIPNDLRFESQCCQKTKLLQQATETPRKLRTIGLVQEYAPRDPS